MLQPKQAVLSGHTRIAVSIETPDFRNERVVSLGAYKEKKENGQRLRPTANKLANLASAIAILFTVASLSTYTYRTVHRLERTDRTESQNLWTKPLAAGTFPDCD